MQRFDSLEKFAAHLDIMALKVGIVPYETAALVAPVLAESIKDVFGKDPPLATLAQSTQIERARLGYSTNEPLVRSGSLRETVEHATEFNLAIAGSNDPVARYSEDGAPNRPPRPVFRIGAIASLPLVKRIFKGALGKALGKR